MAKGKLTRDLTVGASQDIHLKADQEVQVLKSSASEDVIMVQLPDGSNGIYKIDPSAVAVIAPSPAPSTAVATPVVANTASVNQVAPVAPVVAAPKKLAALEPPVATVPAVPPTYPDDFVGGPEFDTIDGKQAAGTASVIKLKDGFQTYIVSARHLLGPDGGFEKQTAAKDVPAFVKSIRIESFSGGSHHYNVTGLLVPATQLDANGGSAIDDTAIYQNHDASPLDQAVVLADGLPAVGTPLWVVARVRGGVPEGQIMQSGRVTSNKSWIIIQFDNDKIITAGASGAPVLNAAGEVVGVYSGHSNEDGHVQGFIIPAPLIAKTIKESPTPTQ